VTASEREGFGTVDGVYGTTGTCTNVDSDCDDDDDNVEANGTWSSRYSVGEVSRLSECSDDDDEVEENNCKCMCEDMDST